MGENSGKINSQRLRAAVLRIRPGTENLGQTQPQAWGTVLGTGTGQARSQGCAGTWLRVWELETSPAANTTGQRLTNRGRGQMGSWPHPGQQGGDPGGSVASQGGHCPEGLDSQLPKHQEVNYINSYICCQAAGCS